MKLSTITSERLMQSSRVVLKIGSALCVDQGMGGGMRHQWLEGLCADVVDMRKAGKQIVIVSSGAISLGLKQLGIDPMHARLEDSQAAAAVGQIQLAHAYHKMLGAHDIVAAQILLTLDNSENRRRYLNASNTLLALLQKNVVPVVNENDTVATQEIRYGDNDRLAARIAQMVSADCLILLSDVDGLYTADPSVDPNGKHILEIDELSDKHWKMAGGARSTHSSGGMRTKVEAARIVMGAGCQMLIASGCMERPIQALQNGARGTWFLPSSTPQASRKQWISGSLKPQGSITVDDGAKAALALGRSLLPVGVIGVTGKFERGVAVYIKDQSGVELGRGLVAYSSDAARSIMGLRSDVIENILGYRGRNELVHRDNLVLISNGSN